MASRALMKISLLITIANLHLSYQWNSCDSPIYCGGELLDAVQRARLFPDSKTFVDMQLTVPPSDTLKDFIRLRDQSNLTKEILRQFISDHFSGPGHELEHWIPPDWTARPRFLNRIKDESLCSWASDLNQLWKILGKKMTPQVHEHPELFSLIPVPNPFIIPGDRFREFYYWDTYWILGGLLTSDMVNTSRGILENFLHVVDQYGFIPNGGRIYYAHRSQPPLLIPMMELYFQTTQDLQFIEENIGILEKEYEFWIQNRTTQVRNKLNNRTYNLAHYKVDQRFPRPEGYMEDLELSQRLPSIEAHSLYSNVAAACESGWDFSTRWFKDFSSLATINTSSIVPVDLNAYLCWNEQIMEKFFHLLGPLYKDKEEMLKNSAEARKHAIHDFYGIRKMARGMTLTLIQQSSDVSFTLPISFHCWLIAPYLIQTKNSTQT